MSFIKILKHKIGKSAKPFIIAEAGINHNGSLNKAFKMIKVAKASNANAIKFQTYKAEELISNTKKKYRYKSNGKFILESMYDIFKRCEFTESDWFKIKKKCDKEKITFLSTPSSFKDLKLLSKLNVPAIKIGSDDFNNIPLIEEARKTKLPLILSCGMSTLNEIETTLTHSGALKGYPVILMLCVSKYPTLPKNVNIERLKYLNFKYPKIKLGFSDHTVGSAAASLALAYGARCFEKHFTLSKNDKGPDHWFSENKDTLTKWIKSIHDSFEMLGKDNIFPIKEEKAMRVLARKSIVSSRNIKKGEVISKNNISFKRPGDGLPPINFKNIIGLKSKKFIKKNTQIKFNFLNK